MPASEQRCRYQSLWQADAEATSRSSGFQRVASPGNAASDDPGMSGLLPPAVTWSRPYSRYPAVPLPRLPVHCTDTAYLCSPYAMPISFAVDPDLISQHVHSKCASSFWYTIIPDSKDPMHMDHKLDSTADAIAASLRELIATGELEGGARLFERELDDRVGISLAPA